MRGIGTSVSRPPVLEALGVGIRHRTGGGVSGVDLRVTPGTALGVVGRSGAGKSTLVRLLLGLSVPHTGEVRWCGAPVPLVGARPTPAVRDVRRALGHVPQDPAGSLSPRRTVVGTLLEPLRRLRVPGDHDALVAEALASVGLDHELLQRRTTTLSGGQAQRVALARALVTGARVVVADEPVSGLDPDLRDQVLGLLAGLVGERRIGLVWVSHDLDATARLCDELLVLDEGRVAEQGPARRLLTAPDHAATRALLDARLRPGVVA